MLSSGDAVPFEYFARLGGGNFRHELRDGENVLVKLFADIAEHNQVGEDQELDGSSDVYCSNMVIMDQVSLSAGFTQYGRLILTNLPRLIRENNRGDLWPHRLIFSEPISRRNPEGLVVWKQFGSTLGYSQLQYLRRLILETASTWQAGALRPLANALEIDALPFDNEYIDFIYPKFNFAFRFDDETKESSTICWMQRLVSESCLGLYDKDDKAVLVAAELRALARWSGEERLASLNFNFSEHASMFFIGASEMLRAGHSDLMIEIAKIDWKANIKYRPFMPALSQALHSGLVARFGSIASYGRVMAFELTGDLRDYAMGVIFVLEPQLYGRTLSESVHYLLKNPDAATQLASNVLLHLRHSESNGATEGGDFWLPSKDRDRPQKRDFNFAYALKNRKLATLNCPHCGHASEEEMSYLQSNDQFKCHLCNKRMHLVPTEKNQFVCPSALVKAWWPADVSKPDGDEIEKIMAVWQLVSDRMKYQRDDAQRESLSDCWYSAKESWRRQAGDCEDHAILLASMLIECGVDCWLVWGDVEPGGSHVWVELVNEGSNRIIEATSKKVLGTLPTYDKAKESYDWAYILNPDYSQRTNGKIVERWQGNQWAPVYDNSAE
jgi:predicted transglutaminase-like cysteine proteinase